MSEQEPQEKHLCAPIGQTLAMMLFEDVDTHHGQHLSLKFINLFFEKPAKCRFHTLTCTSEKTLTLEVSRFLIGQFSARRGGVLNPDYEIKQKSFSRLAIAFDMTNQIVWKNPATFRFGCSEPLFLVLEFVSRMTDYSQASNQYL